MPVAFLLIIAALAGLGIAALAFRRPHAVYRRTAIGCFVGLAGPMVLVLLTSPMLGPHSGLGIAIILYAWWALVLVASVAAVLGATARHFWNAIAR